MPVFFFFSSRRRHTRCSRDWSSDVCSSDLGTVSTTLPRRMELARKVFATTSRYDGLIAMEMERLGVDHSGALDLNEKPRLPERLHLALHLQQELRYEIGRAHV